MLHSVYVYMQGQKALHRLHSLHTGCFRLCFADHESHPLICYSGVLLVVPALVAVNGAAYMRRLPLTYVPVSSDHVSFAAGLERLPLPHVKHLNLGCVHASWKPDECIGELWALRSLNLATFPCETVVSSPFIPHHNGKPCWWIWIETSAISSLPPLSFLSVSPWQGHDFLQLLVSCHEAQAGVPGGSYVEKVTSPDEGFHCPSAAPLTLI